MILKTDAQGFSLVHLDRSAVLLPAHRPVPHVEDKDLGVFLKEPDKNLKVVDLVRLRDRVMSETSPHPLLLRHLPSALPFLQGTFYLNTDFGYNDSLTSLVP